MKIFIVILLFFANHALAQSERPSEESMFGAPEKKSETKEKKQEDAFLSGAVKDNPLTIGGLLYQRLSGTVEQNVGASNTPISAPLQFDLYLDGRPSDQVRGFVDTRLLYDSTRDQYGNVTSGPNLGSTQYSSGGTAPSGLSTTTTLVPLNPQTVLNETWIKFDLDQTVFVTAGKQHLKWGVSRFWNPTDFLTTQKRDPLLPYDLRLGNTMLKLAVPIEAKKTSFYAITLFDNPQPSSTLGQMGEALRAETVIGNTEIGVDAVYRGNVTPVYGADISSPLGPFDIYAESSYITAPPNPLYQIPGGTLNSSSDLSTQFTSTPLSNQLFQVSGGINYSFAWTDNRQATFGVEYFYNQLGYTNSNAYPVLLLLGQYQPFYLGRNYAGVYLTAEGPDKDKHTSYTFSTLGNLSDNSFISRIDFSWRFLTYLTFEAFVDGHYGTPGGEFYFSMNTPAVTYQGSSIPAVNVPLAVADVGLALRLAL